MSFDDFVINVQKWSEIRGLHEGDPRSQYLKVVEEVGEIASGLARDNIELTKDGIGDVFVTLIILAQKLNVGVGECIDMAWNDIKDRNGMMVNDVFIKEADFTEVQKLQFAEKQGGFKID